MNDIVYLLLCMNDMYQAHSSPYAKQKAYPKTHKRDGRIYQSYQGSKNFHSKLLLVVVSTDPSLPQLLAHEAYIPLYMHACLHTYIHTLHTYKSNVLTTYLRTPQQFTYYTYTYIYIYNYWIFVFI